MLLTAAALGVAHGLEPDHMAGITALTHEAANPRLSMLVGACFAVGHVVLVVLWIALATLLFRTSSFPAHFERFGLLAVGIVLTLLSLYLGYSGTRKLLHRHSHDHGDGRHTHVHLHLPGLMADDGHDHGLGVHDHDDGDHAHSHGLAAYLKIGTIGALFTLSPPVSMIAFISVAMAEGTSATIVGVVAVYAVTIVATMAVIGAGTGTLFGIAKENGSTYHAYLEVVASVAVLAVAVSLLVGNLPIVLT